MVRNKKKNGGYTLVELVVIVAVIAVLATLTFMGIGSVMGFKAVSCADRIISYMTETKTNTLGFDDVKLRLYYGTDEYKCDIGSQMYNVVIDPTTNAVTKTLADSGSTSYAIGDKNLTITYKLAGDSTVYDLKSTPLTIRFDSASGAFRSAFLYDSTDDLDKDSGKYLESIQITQNSKTVTIKCVRFTGKFYKE